MFGKNAISFTRLTSSLMDRIKLFKCFIQQCVFFIQNPEDWFPTDLNIYQQNIHSSLNKNLGIVILGTLYSLSLELEKSILPIYI